MRGRDGKTYYDSASNWATPTWVEIAKIIDETITPSAELASGGDRSEEYEDNEISMRKFEWNCTYRYRKASVGADSVYAALLTAFEAGTKLYMAFMDGAIATSGSRGWRAPILIDQMPQQRNLGDLVEVTVHGVGRLSDVSGTVYSATSYTVPA